jgi:hypothetical protein
VSYAARKADWLVRATDALHALELSTAIDLLRGVVLCERAEPHARRAVGPAAAGLVVHEAGVPA